MSKQGSNSCRFTKIILPIELSAEPAVLTACLKIQQTIRPPEGQQAQPPGRQGTVAAFGAQDRRKRNQKLYDMRQALVPEMPSGTNRTHAELNGQVHLLCAHLNVGGLGLRAVGGRDHRGTVITAGKEKPEPWDCRMTARR